MRQSQSAIFGWPQSRLCINPIGTSGGGVTGMANCNAAL